MERLTRYEPGAWRALIIGLSLFGLGILCVISPERVQDWYLRMPFCPPWIRNEGYQLTIRIVGFAILSMGCISLYAVFTG